MRKNVITASIRFIGFGVVFSIAAGISVKAADDSPKTAPITVLSSAGLRAPVEMVRAQAEKAVGHPLAIQWGGSSGYKTKIEAGEQFDVAILLPEAVEDLIKQGKILAGTQAVIGRVGISVGLRGDAPKPDISTPDALKRAFLSAKSIRYAGSGASRATVDAMIAKLGIGDAIKAKTMFSLDPPAKLAKGETELVMYLVSEMKSDAAEGKIVYLGPLPEAVQGYAVMSAGVSAHASDEKAARAFIQFLKGPALDPALKTAGMQR